MHVLYEYMTLVCGLLYGRTSVASAISSGTSLRELLVTDLRAASNRSKCGVLTLRLVRRRLDEYLGGLGDLIRQLFAHVARDKEGLGQRLRARRRRVEQRVGPRPCFLLLCQLLSLLALLAQKQK